MLKAIHLGGHRVYSLSAGKTHPEFVSEAIRNNQSLRYNEEYRRRVELLQNFDFSISSQKVLISPDEQYIAAVGIYPPEIRMYDTTQLGLKFVRGLDHEVIDFQFLSDDYKKLVFLQNNRGVEFHAQGGRHHAVRIPKPGRALCYNPQSAELNIVGSSNSIFRLDLEQGQFLEPLASKCDELNCCILNPVLPLCVVGGSRALVECWDTRLNKAVTVLSLNNRGQLDEELEVTAGAFSPDGLRIAVGLSNGVVKVFDIRSSRSICERDHRNGEPIQTVNWTKVAPVTKSSSFTASSHSSDHIDSCIVSNDKSSVKLWNDKTAELLASIESNAIAKETMKGSNLVIRGVSFYPNSGLCFIPCDQTRIGICFIPSVGLAPRWCSFLDSLTEELEDAKAVSHGIETAASEFTNGMDSFNTRNTVYDDYQFLTKQQLEQLGISQLIGTSMLRAYMHGYFMDSQLYQKIKDIVEPFDYEAYRRQKIKEKAEARTPMRINIKKPSVAVNAQLVEKLTNAAAPGEGKTSLKKTKKKCMIQANNILTDKRFSKLFTHPDFAIETLPLQE